MASKGSKQYKKYITLGIALVILVVVAIFLMIENGDIVFLEIIGRFLKETWWILLPIPIWKLFLSVWEEYVGFMWAKDQKNVLLEVIPPSDLEKSPKIMEQIFMGLHTWSGPNLLERYCGWKPGQDVFSFEIVSSQGVIHFYIRCPLASRNHVEAQVYAQYPDAEIYEAEDYTRNVPKNLPNKEWDVWGSSMKLAQRDEIPIRTYNSFVEDITGKMIDPLSALTEVMSSIGKDQHVWFQMVCSPAFEGSWYPRSLDFIEEMLGRKKEEKKGKGFFSYLGELVVLPGNIIRGMMAEELVAPDESDLVEESSPEFNINKLSPGEQDKVKAIYNNISKPGFKTTIRVVYLGKRENFNKALGVAGVIGAIRQFNDLNLNSIFPDPRSKTAAEYYRTQSRLEYKQRRVVFNYRNRDFAVGSFIFNTEELATIFHFPDMSVKAPNMTRIEAKKGEAPQNLPIEFEPSI